MLAHRDVHRHRRLDRARLAARRRAAGGSSSASTTRWCARRWCGGAGPRSRRSATAFSRRSTGRPRGVRCAAEIVDQAGRLGLHVRAGLHTGECELVGGDVAGIAVHIGARVMARSVAPARCSRRARSRTSWSAPSSGSTTAARTSCSGVPDAWRLYALKWGRMTSPSRPRAVRARRRGPRARSSVGSASGPRTRDAAPRRPVPARSRRRTTCPARTGAASSPARAAAPAAAQRPDCERRRRSSAARSCGSDGSRSGATASITCSAWPSITAITACTRSIVARSASAVTTEIRSPRRSAPTTRRSSAPVGSRSLRGASIRSSAVSSSSLHEPGHVALQPRHAGELDRVGDLVQRHPGHELAARRRRSA